ncbi:MAG TPA: response regulator [Chloroflexota bacterium]|jgi:DNA-binding response OmpR family regulator
MAGSILLIEDDLTLSRAIARNLAAHGYPTHVAATVEQAREIIARERPELVLLDISLPDGSGWEIVRALRVDQRRPVPIIVMSALRPNPRLVAEMDCVGVLEKPFPMDSLLRMTRQYLGWPEATPAVE